MHKCLKCGKEFEGKFCPDCGAKWIDPDACPKCGARRDPDAKFCPECGARLDGKMCCPKCGTLMDENATFCAECGMRLNGQPAAAVKREPISAKTIIALCGVGLILLSALMGLIFTFVSGVSIVDTGSGKRVDTEMLYYYFGNAYKELKDAKIGINASFGWKSMGEVREFALYFPVVIGTVVAALGILGVVSLSALTGYKAYKKYYLKQDVNVIAPAVGTYFTFIAMSTLLVVLNSTKAGGIRSAFSSATLAGAITGGVLLALGLIVLAATNYKEFKNFNVTFGTIFSVAICAIIVVLVAIVALPACKMEVIVTSDYYDLDIVSGSYGLFIGMQTMLLFVRSDEAISEIIAYGTVGGVMAVALAIVCAVSLVRKAPALGDGKNRSNLVLSVVTVVLSALYLVFAILFNNTSIDTLVEIFRGDYSSIEGASALISRSYAVPIAMVVLSAVALAGELIAKFVRKPEEISQATEQVAE